MNLDKRGVMVGGVECSMCFNEVESTDHLLIRCPFAVKVWKRIGVWCGWSVAQVDFIREKIDHANNINGSEKVKDIASMIIMATTWYIWLARIWLARNDLIFNSRALSVDGVVEKIMVNTFLWLKYRANRFDVMWHKWCNSPW